MWHDSYVLVLLAVAALAVLYCVVIVSQGRGGELTEFAPDVPPLDLPDPGQLTAVDVMVLQLPVSLVGYHTQSVDETLQRAATALGERDTHIAVLEQRVAELLAGRLQARQESQTGPSWAPAAEPVQSAQGLTPGVVQSAQGLTPGAAPLPGSEPAPGAGPFSGGGPVANAGPLMGSEPGPGEEPAPGAGPVTSGDPADSGGRSSGPSATSPAGPSASPPAAGERAADDGAVGTGSRPIAHENRFDPITKAPAPSGPANGNAVTAAGRPSPKTPAEPISGLGFCRGELVLSLAVTSELVRCGWATSAADYVRYHDEEWGRPVHGDDPVYERLTLEAFQSGSVLADDPAQARELPRGLLRLLDPRRRRVRRLRRRTAAGRRGHRPQPSQDRGGDRQRSRGAGARPAGSRSWSGGSPTPILRCRPRPPTCPPSRPVPGRWPRSSKGGGSASSAPPPLRADAGDRTGQRPHRRLLDPRPHPRGRSGRGGRGSPGVMGEPGEVVSQRPSKAGRALARKARVALWWSSDLAQLSCRSASTSRASSRGCAAEKSSACLIAP